MFEKAKSITASNTDYVSMRARFEIDPASDAASSGSGRGEALPLRAIEWSELTARLSAARDLRQLLREDLGVGRGGNELGFADAAAQFFRTGEDDEPGVNLSALEGRKASSGMYQNVKGAWEENTPFADHDSADKVAMTRYEPGDAREEQ